MLVITDTDSTVPMLPNDMPDGTEAVTCVEVVSVVSLVKLLEGRGGNSRLKLDPPVMREEFHVTKGSVGDDSEVVKRGTVSKADIDVEASDVYVFFRVKPVESVAVPLRTPALVNVMLVGLDGLVRTSFFEVDVVVLMASVVTTETEFSLLSVSEDIRWCVDDWSVLEVDIASWLIELVLASDAYPLFELVEAEAALSP